MRESVAIPAVRQKRSKLAPTSCHASFTSAVVSGPGAVIILFMALPFFVESAPRAYRLKGATPTLLFQHRTGHPRVNQPRAVAPSVERLVEATARTGRNCGALI